MLCMTFPQFLAGEALSLGICPALPATSPAPAGEAPASNAADAQGHLGFYVSAEGLHDKSCAWAETQKTGRFRDRLHLLAVRGGFEPPVRLIPYGSLANCWFQPLTHLTRSKLNVVPILKRKCCPLLKRDDKVNLNLPFCQIKLHLFVQD